MTSETRDARYRERLLPGMGFFIALLLLIPASALVMTPINASAAIPTALALYVLFASIFLLTSPVVSVEHGTLTAGRAEIPVALIGEVEALGADALRSAIGPGADARNYLLVRGWIRRGVRLEIVDPADPTPQWIITTRKPLALSDAIERARNAAAAQ